MTICIKLQVLAFKKKKRRWRQHLFNRMSKMNVLELRNICIIRLSVLFPCSSLEICLSCLFWDLSFYWLYLHSMRRFPSLSNKNGVVVNNIISIIILIELGLSYSIAEFSNLIGELFNWISERSNWIAELSNCALIELQSSPIAL